MEFCSVLAMVQAVVIAPRAEASEAKQSPVQKNVGATGRSPLLRRLSPSCLCVARRQARNDDESVPPLLPWQLCAAWNKCFTAAAPRDLIKKVVQECVCSFSFFLLEDGVSEDELGRGSP
jgi:hypothetical protein